MNQPRNLEKAALRGEPSYVWREGQKRRLRMILEAAGDRTSGVELVDGCGVGMYVHHLQEFFSTIIGLDIEFERLQEAKLRGKHLVNGRGEILPFSSNSFSFVLNHEVLEHVDNDQAAITEIIRVLEPGGRLVLLCPNRGYPFETHGVYWRGKYHFGNIPLINYLPRAWRDRLAPHVNVFTRKDLNKLFDDLPVNIIHCSTIFGAYDNIIARWPKLGNLLKKLLQGLEKTPLQRLGLSHFWVVEKI